MPKHPRTLTASETLRVVRSVLADPNMSPQERIALLAVVTQANGATGLSWTSYEQMRKKYHIGRTSIAGALSQQGGKGIGRYVALEKKGAHGAHCYRILPDGEPQQSQRGTAGKCQRSQGKTAGSYQQSCDKQQRSCERHQQSQGETHTDSYTVSNTGSAAAPSNKGEFRLAPPEQWEKPKSDGTVRRLIALWAKRYGESVGRPLPNPERNRVVGVLKARVRELPEDQLADAVEKWFGTRRKDYGVALFAHRLDGGDQELLNREQVKHHDYDQSF
ncbi:MAG: hypothetical protein ACLFVU_14055 [Phycisphaerae bacterium]